MILSKIKVDFLNDGKTAVLKGENAKAGEHFCWQNAPLFRIGLSGLPDDDFAHGTVAHADDVDAFLRSADAFSVGTEAGDFLGFVCGGTLYAGGGSYTDGKRGFGQFSV